MEEILLANAALTLLDKLLPRIQQMVKDGQVSVEEQKATWDKYHALRNKVGNPFMGPEWEA